MNNHNGGHTISIYPGDKKLPFVVIYWKGLSFEIDFQYRIDLCFFCFYRKLLPPNRYFVLIFDFIASCGFCYMMLVRCCYWISPRLLRCLLALFWCLYLPVYASLKCVSSFIITHLPSHSLLILILLTFTSKKVHHLILIFF